VLQFNARTVTPLSSAKRLPLKVEFVMPESNATTFRSQYLMNCHDTALLIVDFQEKLVPLIQDHQRVQWNIQRLIEGAHTLGVRIVATEQYPQGLGKTVPIVLDALKNAGVADLPAKTMFSCRQCRDAIASLRVSGIQKILIAGIETHVCVAQTGFDLLAEGFSIYLAVDAVGSRHAKDHQIAIGRLENAGATPTTTEAALFEWCETADNVGFKRISQLIRQSSP
jgi:nicotinamidase-related amidase